MATITEDYVSFETAKLLEKKGFEGDISAYYHIWDNGTRVCSVQEFSHSEAPHLYIPAPTLQMAMKWLREVHNISLNIIFIKLFDKGYWSKGYWTFDNIEYNSYEQACEAAIKYCLENLI